MYMKNEIVGILDRHHVWRSHDPTSVQTFGFCEENFLFLRASTDTIKYYIMITCILRIHI